MPRYVQLVPGNSGWRLDLDSLREATMGRRKAFLMMSPSMPTGAVLDRVEWQAVCQACIDTNAWMIHDSAMERLLFKGVAHHNPLHWPGMAERTVTVGAVSKEYRMIGWRVGWIVCPLGAAEAIGRVAISNVVCPVGIAQQAAALAIETDDEGLASCASTWQQRHDHIVKTLGADFDVVQAHGGWSLLVDFAGRGLSGAAASRALMAQGVAATSMENWGTPGTGRYLRLVYSNEPLHRLADLARRFAAAFERPSRS